MVVWTSRRMLASSSTTRTVCRLRIPLLVIRLKGTAARALSIASVVWACSSCTRGRIGSLPAKTGDSPMQINGRGSSAVQVRRRLRIRRSEPDSAMQQSPGEIPRVIHGDSLLNTKEAARFLRVSEASIRRWSDAGLLPARRVGRRRERRFAQADLLRFLGQPGGEKTAAAHASLAAAVIVGGLSVPLRSHLAPFFGTDEGGLRLTVPFLAEGLKAHQPCFLVATGTVLERYARALREEHEIDLGAAVRGGRLTVLDGPGRNPAQAIANWERLFGKALAGGPAVLRVVGEMACVRRMFASDAEMMSFEEAFDVMAKRFPGVWLCQYDAREFDGEIMLRALKAHPDMYAQHLGGFLN